MLFYINKTIFWCNLVYVPPQCPPGTAHEHPSRLAPLLSGLIQSILWGGCSREKDVADANKRIITKGSKRSPKIYSVWTRRLLQETKRVKDKTERVIQRKEREGKEIKKMGEEEEKKGLSSVSHGGGHLVPRFDWCAASSIPASLCLSRFQMSITLSYSGWWSNSCVEPRALLKLVARLFKVQPNTSHAAFDGALTKQRAGIRAVSWHRVRVSSSTKSRGFDLLSALYHHHSCMSTVRLS